MFAAVASPSGAFYLVCAADITSGGFTSCQASDPNTHYISIGGTSASTPVFAGIMALVNQATGARQGNANYVLYKLAAAERRQLRFEQRSRHELRLLRRHQRNDCHALRHGQPELHHFQSG